MNDYVYVAAAKTIRGLLKIVPTGRVKSNRIVFCSFLGKSYSCSPKYISEYLEKYSDKYEIVWGLVHKEDYSYLSERGIKVVKYNSFEFVKLCMTAKYVVTNTHDLTHIPFSKDQIVINTWHGGGGYKKVGNQKNIQNPADKFRDEVFTRTPYVYLSSCEMFTKTNIRESFNHSGPVLNTGLPRNDILIQQNRDDIREKVYRKYQIPKDHKLVLYAPTFRAERTACDYEMNFGALKCALKNRFGGEWDVLVRMHYYVTEHLDTSSQACVDVSRYEDMQELLYASDVLITDYSSSMWDFSQMYKPCFLYVTDLEKYDVERGFYTSIYTWPFPLAQNNNELIRAIEHFDKSVYDDQVKAHHETYGSFEEGDACRKVVEFMETH